MRIVLDRESDFATGGHPDLLIAFSARLPDSASMAVGPKMLCARASPRQDDFAKRPILRQMAQGFARLAEGIDPLDDRLD